MNDWTIRRAAPTLEDARRLLAIENASLGDSDYTPRQALAVLRRPEQHALLALEGDEAVGFCSCLFTPTTVGARLEIDLLGVLPSHQGRGLGTALIWAAQQEACGQGIRQVRAVVAVDNAASLRAFARNLIAPVGPPRALLVYAIHGFAPRESLPCGWQVRVLHRGAVTSPTGDRFDAGQGRTVHCISQPAQGTVALGECLQVHTLCYRGLWLETAWSADDEALAVLLRWLVEYAKRRKLDEVGHLCDAPADSPARQVWLAEGYTSVGDYYVLQGRLR